ncbi:MAG TPA: hypothetical protein VNX01_14200 [Bacteroidia bacterium]|jgi:hypothetical protein|nr:hypothetical protein [Bacteroidia bacterium]
MNKLTFVLMLIFRVLHAQTKIKPLLLRQILITVLCILYVSSFSQHNYVYKGKVYKVYYSFEEASKVNPDSVFGLVLKSKGFKGFPKEIFKYKNMQILDLGAFNWDEAYSTLMTSKEQKKADKKKKKLGNLYYPPCYKSNNIFDIPIMEVKTLTGLVYLNIDCCGYKSKVMCELLKMMPQLEIYPNIEQNMFDITGKECKCR